MKLLLCIYSCVNLTEVPWVNMHLLMGSLIVYLKHGILIRGGSDYVLTGFCQMLFSEVISDTFDITNAITIPCEVVGLKLGF